MKRIFACGVDRTVRLVLLFFALLVGAIIAKELGAADFSQPVGFFKIAITAGGTNSFRATSLSAPYHPIHRYRGTLSSATSNTVTVAGSTDWVTNEFAPTNGFTQFILLVRKDASASPGVQGDWWEILSNTTNTVTVANGPDNLSSLLGSGDELEIRRLNSIADMFGLGASTILDKDADGDPQSTDGDYIRHVVGTSFTQIVFFHDSGGVLGPTGYYIGDIGPLDGSTITVLPNQVLVFFRKPNAPATNAVSAGQAQLTRFTHYLEKGGDTIGAVYPANARLDQSFLLESGWIADSNGFPAASEEDYFRVVAGTSFTDLIFYHNGSLGPAGWYVNDVLSNSFPFLPTRAYTFFLWTNRTDALRWRQTVPFTP
jgi:uncharacterized protein (TIGR02597 family)